MSIPTKKKKISTTPVPIIKLVPNFLTLLGLIIGVSGMRFSLDQKWQLAVYCILAASLIDGIDGRIARKFNATSPFGAELDSLCDFANFGICPAFIMYLWSMQRYEYKMISWAVMLIFMACMAIRLARFNINISDASKQKESEDIIYYNKHFFNGMPAPMAAVLVLMPIIIDFDINNIFFGIDIRTYTLGIDLYIFIIAFFVACRLPTFSLKNTVIKQEYLSIFMLGCAVLIIGLIIYPWRTIPLLGALYLLSIPCSIIMARKGRKKI